MRVPSLLAGSLLSTTILAGTNYIHNNCNFDIWFTSVSTSSAPEPTKLPPGAYSTEDQYFYDTGTAIKVIRSANGLYTAAPVLHMSYTYHQGEDIYYDLSSAFGFAFWGFNVTVDASAEGAPDLRWDGAPKPNYTAHYAGETDLTLTLCA